MVLLPRRLASSSGTSMLDVPALGEADHREDDQGEFDGDEQQGDRAEVVAAQSTTAEQGLRRREAWVVPIEPAGSGQTRGGDDGDDQQEDPQQGSQGQKPARPAEEDEAGQQQVGQAPDEVDRLQALELAPAADRQHEHQRHRGQQDEHDDQPRQLADRLVPVGMNDRVAGPDVPYLSHERGRYLLIERHAAVSSPLADPGAAYNRPAPSPRRPAGVAELVYAPALGAGGRKPLGVRVPPPALCLRIPPTRSGIMPASVVNPLQVAVPSLAGWERRSGCDGYHRSAHRGVS